MLTDLEITKLCAEAMGFRGHFAFLGYDMATGKPIGKQEFLIEGVKVFDPLNIDGDAMALVKKLGLQVGTMLKSGDWMVWPKMGRIEARNAELNRAICECVAKMQAAAPRSTQHASSTAQSEAE